MTKSRPLGGWCMSRTRLLNLLARGLLLARVILFSARAQGTGFYGPYEYLSGGDYATETPEFYWDLEVKRMAREFHPKERPAIVPRTLSDSNQTVDPAPMAKATADADAADFAAAIKDGSLKTDDLAADQKQHALARISLLTTGTAGSARLPDEFDSEFADYDRGAFAYRQARWDDARKAWLALLGRPAPQRHYRTVWAAFMLGRLALKNSDPAAVQWFQKTRALAAQGFADSLGMAADSYGWEARSELRQGHPETAAPLFLTQLALGDESAVVSLKALIPDRDDVDGMLNYGQNGEEQYFKGWDAPAPSPPTDDQKKAAEPALIAKLKVMAADPLLRRLETAHILAMESGASQWDNDSAAAPARSARWLGIIRAANLQHVEDAEYLGWLAYNTGSYKDAQHWLDLGAGDTPMSAWLRARLEMRAGQTKVAALSMQQAWQGVLDPTTYTGWKGPQDDNDSSIYVYGGDEGQFTMAQWATGDLCTVHLLRNDFIQALDTFLKGGLRSDAAYIAERVLTTAELKTYVDQMPKSPPVGQLDDSYRVIGDATVDDTTWLRNLLGRRLVREEQYAEAIPYMPPAYGKLLAKYSKALQNGADSKLPRAARADNWSTAAWIARFDGMELMGTEVAPDGFDTAGAFQDTDLVAQRASGVFSQIRDGNSKTLPIPFPPTKAELARIRKDPIQPDIRYHYRIIAAALAMRAAALMDDNTEQLADTVNNAGLWVKDSNDKLGDRYYDVIERRCSGTKIGKDVLAKHWFIDEPGPWSTALKTQADTLHKQFGIQAPD